MVSRAFRDESVLQSSRMLLRHEILPDLVDTGDQTTQFLYGTTLADSDIASSQLKRAEIYPDSVDNDDRITFKYNRQGERKELQDQNGTVHAYDFDLLGRETHDRVTTAGTGVDTAVLRISKTYEVRGMLEKLTSYDNATVGSGSIVNEVLFQYNAFAQITHDYQSHAGAVNTSTTPYVGYAYADGSANTIRQTKLIYPNGRELNYSYGTANSMADALSRCTALVDDDGTTVLVSYQYLGLNTFVIADYEEPDVRWTLVGTAGGNDPDTGDIYRGLDRFSRVKDNYWHNYNSNTDVDRIKYGYDRAGNRTWRENTVAAALGKKFDEAYVNDVIQRLKHMDRGTLNALKTAIQSGTLTFSQCWQLDETGNSKGFREDSDGTGVDLIQQRTINKVNEITDVTESLGPSWVTPAYNLAGNMTTVPKPEDPTTAFTAVYDAWNRLVRLSNGSHTVTTYAYDGAKRRIVQDSYTAGVLSENRHLFYTEPSKWQVVEERLGTSAVADRQFVWGNRYIDDLVLRDGAIERYYATQDANWNITAAVPANAVVAERYAYSAYGSVHFLTTAFLPQVASAIAWETLFGGYRYESLSTLFHVRHRVLHPSLGAWIQRDPMMSHSLYQYCDSRPLVFTDPSGEVAPAAAAPAAAAPAMGLATELLILCLGGAGLFGLIDIGTQLYERVVNGAPFSLGRLSCEMAMGCVLGLCAFGAFGLTGLGPLGWLGSAALVVGCAFAIAYLCRGCTWLMNCPPGVVCAGAMDMLTLLGL